MTSQKPANIKEEDWTQTPPKVRAHILKTSSKLRQLESVTPQAQARPDASPVPEPAATPQKEALVGRLLVVDDNEMNRDMLTRRLRRQGHTIDVAINGRQALDMIKSQDFDLILLDVMMPQMNGYEVLEHLKNDDSIPYIPVIMITAVDQLDSLVRCIELGAEDYLTKPFNPVLLKARIGASLEKKRLRDQQTAYTQRLNLENRRKTNELEQARHIQLAMLPAAPPAVPYLDIAAHQETASEVGGDYYDFFPQQDGRLFMAIGDATGHGVGSGIMVAMTKAILLGTTETDLSILAGNINNILCRTDLGYQLNMALMLLDIVVVEDGRLAVRAAGGGMPPVYLLRAGGAFESKIVSGLPLGVIPQTEYEMVAFQLNPGDTMLLMSDGLPEIFNADHQFMGFDQLADDLARLDVRGLSAAQVLEKVSALGHGWAQGHPLYDDMTLVVIRVVED